MKSQELIPLYKEMAELTLPKCKQCRVPLSCCSLEYCQIALQYAKEEWNVDLSDKVTNHPTLLFMGEHGCGVEPHLRPLCTLHTCTINAVGMDPDRQWDKKYWKLRTEIDHLEFGGSNENH